MGKTLNFPCGPAMSGENVIMCMLEHVLLASLTSLLGSEASNACSKMHTIPFSPDMAGPQGNQYYSTEFTVLTP